MISADQMSRATELFSLFPTQLTLDVSTILEDSELRRYLERINTVQHVICHKKSRICFVITEAKTIVICSTGTFLIRYDHKNYRRKLALLREMIIRKEMKSITDLIDYCEFKPCNFRNQMCGLELVPTKLEWHI